MKKTVSVFILMIVCGLTISAQQTLPPTAILKPTLTVRAVKDANYWKMPDAKNYWSWMPKVEFWVTGPIADASFLTFDFTMPDGKPWYSWDTGPFSVAEGKFYAIESEAVPRWTDRRSTVETGVFGFKVTLKNNLAGTSKELYRGKYTVGKKFAGTPLPDFKNQWAFYVDQDWALPIGYVTLDYASELKAPRPVMSMWFRGDFDASRLAGYLYHNGKLISSTAYGSGQGAASTAKVVITSGDDNKEVYWALWNFGFYNVRAYDLTGGYKTAHILYSNPGKYEIKVLLDGDLVRTAGFTVGADGKVVDDGVAAKNGFPGMGIVIPVKVLPGKEGTVNLQSWKTGAFYENPLTGFIAQ